ncbi:MAG: hypothetical protein ACK55Z_07695 [bacterium]
MSGQPLTWQGWPTTRLSRKALLRRSFRSLRIPPIQRSHVRRGFRLELPATGSNSSSARAFSSHFENVRKCLVHPRLVGVDFGKRTALVQDRES